MLLYVLDTQKRVPPINPHLLSLGERKQLGIAHVIISPLSRRERRTRSGSEGYERGSGGNLTALAVKFLPCERLTRRFLLPIRPPQGIRGVRNPETQAARMCYALWEV
jgi:hypothetical protein